MKASTVSTISTISTVLTVSAVSTISIVSTISTVSTIYTVFTSKSYFRFNLLSIKGKMCRTFHHRLPYFSSKSNSTNSGNDFPDPPNILATPKMLATASPHILVFYALTLHFYSLPALAFPSSIQVFDDAPIY